MALVKDLKLGVQSYVDAVKFIGKHKLWFYFIFPILIFLGIYYLGFTFESLKDQASRNQDDDAGFFATVWGLFVWGIFYVLSYMIFNFMRYILLILMSPVLSVVSERVERIITGNTYKFNLKQLIKDIKRTINLSIRNMIWELGIGALIALSLWIVGKIIGIDLGVVSTSVIMIVAFYYYGFGFIDYMSERRRMNITESVKFVRQHRGFAIVLGTVFTVLFHYTNTYLNSLKDSDGVSDTLFLVVIVASSIIMAIIPIWTMVAATLGMHELVDLNTNPHAIKSESKEVTDSEITN